MWRQLTGIRDPLGPLWARRVDHGDPRQIQAVQQIAVFGVGEQDLAVGAPDVAEQCVSTSCVVDPRRDVAAERARRDGDQHGGGVPQQCADVHRAGGVGVGEDGGRRAAGLVDVLAPGPSAVLVGDRHVVVVAAFGEELGHGVGHAPNLERVPPTGGQIRENVY